MGQVTDARSDVGGRRIALRLVATVALVGWLVVMTLIEVGMRRDYLLGFVVILAGVFVSLQLPKARRILQAASEDPR